jgi:hypothetical protein
MADFYPVLSRAVSRLDNNTQEARYELFARARTIAAAQLRSKDPPLAAKDIARELAALDAAIRKIEAESRPRPSRGPVRPAPASAPVNRSAAVNQRKEATPARAAATKKQESAAPAKAPPKDVPTDTEVPHMISMATEMTAMSRSLGTMMAGVAFSVGALALIAVVYVRGLVLVENGIIGYPLLLGEVVLLLGLFSALPFVVFRNPRVASAIDYLVKLIYSALRRSLEFSR